jgi:hypothetical protein
LVTGAAHGIGRAALGLSIDVADAESVE